MLSRENECYNHGQTGSNGEYMLRLRVKEVAESKGFNKSTLSRKADIPLSTMRRVWNNPYYQVQLETLHKIAQALGVPTAELLEEDPR